MTSKEIVMTTVLSYAVSAAEREGLVAHDDIERRIQDEDMLGRDMTRWERNIVRSFFGMAPEVTETERCA